GTVRAFVDIFREANEVGDLLPMLLGQLAVYYDLASVQQRFREVGGPRYVDEEMLRALAAGYVIHRVDAGETLTKSAFVRKVIEMNSALPDALRFLANGSTYEVNVRRSLDRALNRHAADIPKWEADYRRYASERADEMLRRKAVEDMLRQ